MKIDLSEFCETYLQECAEHLASMEANLLALRSAPGDVAILNAIFRVAHSIKGGAASFGLKHLTRVTHALESLLESLRALEMRASDEVISLLLQSVDILRAMLDDTTDDPMPEEALRLIQRIESLLAAVSKNSEGSMTAVEKKASAAGLPGGADALSLYRVDFRPHGEMFLSGADPGMLLRNLAALGTVRVCEMQVEDLLTLQQLDPLLGYLRWTVELASTSSEERLREVFEFVEHVADIDIGRLVRAPATPESEPQAAPLADLATRRSAEERRMVEARRAVDLRDVAKKSVTVTGTSSIRVATDKVDRLIEMVGELVNAQEKTAQMMQHFEPARLPKLREAVDAMERSTRELQKRVMEVRMMPVGPLFQRYARVLDDIAQSIGKQIRLDTEGEETEIDKSMLELLGDTLTHLVRNAADHGIEQPAARISAGKPEEGVIRLRAFHRAGRIVIQVSDDGAGIESARVRAKAVEQGLIDAGADLSDEQVRMLIFEPGFSTREAVNHLSGRGVGMDVVKRNVQQLSGTVALESIVGGGSTVSIELPLKLASL